MKFNKYFTSSPFIEFYYQCFSMPINGQSVSQLGLGQGCGVQRVKVKFHEEIITAKRKPFALCLS
jgi:hypothetical protein